MIRIPALLTASVALAAALATAPAQDYTVVDTGQTLCYDAAGRVITPPIAGAPYHGQDAQHASSKPSYLLDAKKETVYDVRTGLTWQKAYVPQKLTFAQALAYPATLNAARFGGHADWRLPTIKELYSLIDFSGWTGMSAATSQPYIDTRFFDFAYGDPLQNERFIDAQYWSATEYVGLTMNNDPTVFGVNFADGRIKGYPKQDPRQGLKTMFVRFVRGNAQYGVNRFVDNLDGTVSDLATGLMWAKTDNGKALSWQQALAYADTLVLAGKGDWRLPNAKELQSLVDYSRAPDATVSTKVGPAIDPVFQVTNIGTASAPDYGYYWTGTTHVDGLAPDKAVYIAFGQAWGWMEQPPLSNQYVRMNVHGAGCQRSDFKSGNPALYPHGHGPQGDEVRIFNLIRVVRTESGPLQGLVARLIGQGCGSGVMVVPGDPTCSTPLPVSLTGAGAGKWAFLILGDSTSRWQTYALPLDLGTYGAPGCHLYTNVLVGWGAAMKTGGARVNLPLPPVGPWLPAWGGVHLQWAYDRSPGLPGFTAAVSLVRPGG